jgi:hypothetical protein
MEKHIKLVGILNIVYRSLALIGAIVLAVLGFSFGYIYEALVQNHSIRSCDVPVVFLDLVPILLLFAAALIFIISVAGILGGIGVLNRKEWGRVLLLIVSFFNLIRIPLGTLLGIYTIWVLFSNDTIKYFSSNTPGNQPLAV